MKTKSLLAFISFLVFFPFPNFGQEEEKRDEILQHHFKAVGQEKLSGVESIKMIGRSKVQGNEFPFTVYIKDPNLVRNEITVQGQKMIQAFDGENGWMVVPWMSSEPKDLSGIQVKNMKGSANIEGDLYKWKEKGHQLEYLGEDEIDGTPVYHLELTKNNGDVINYYLDRDSYFALKQTIKTTVDNQELEMETYLSKYEIINGMAFPMNIESSFVGQSSQVIIDSVELNVSMEQTLFQRPEN